MGRVLSFHMAVCFSVTLGKLQGVFVKWLIRLTNLVACKFIMGLPWYGLVVLHWTFALCFLFSDCSKWKLLLSIHWPLGDTAVTSTHWGWNEMADILKRVQLTIFQHAGWETNARPLYNCNASENLAGQVKNRPGQVEFCIGYIRDYSVRASANKF